MMPYPIVETRTSSRAVLETTAILQAGVPFNTVFSNFAETVDFLGGRHNSFGVGGGNVGSLYTYDPSNALPGILLDFYIYAEAAGPVLAPGALGVWAQVLTPTDPATFLPEKMIASVIYSGDVLDYTTAAGAQQFTRRNHPLVGTLRVSARRFYVGFINSSGLDQTVFRLGVYARGE